MGDGNGKAKPVFEVFVGGKLDLKTGSRKHALDTANYKLAAGAAVEVRKSVVVFSGQPAGAEG